MRNTFILHLLYYLRASSFWKWVKRRRKLRNMLSMEGIDEYLDLHYNQECTNREELKKEIYSIAKKYQLQKWEFISYRLHGKDDAYIRSFVSDIEWGEFCRKVNPAQNKYKFWDKFACYETFKPYYMRDCVRLPANMRAVTPETIASKENRPLLDFLRKHHRFMVKPVGGATGKNIELYDVEKVTDGHVPMDDDLSGWSRVLNGLVETYSPLHPRDSILEELIVQVPEIARLHPASLNTVRMPTVNLGDHVELLPPFFRMGRGGSVVDNVGAGGIMATVDLDTGKLIHASDKYGNPFEEHSDSLIPLVGFQIPKWQECKELAKKLATVVPANRYTGWDLALTEKGWVMVEGNSAGQAVWQIPGQVGWRKGYEDICRKVGIKY